MTENEFIEFIDCQFPYELEEEWRPLIVLAASISPNAAFMVLHELCRLPNGTKVNREALQAMLECWKSNFTHPLVVEVLPAAEAMINGCELTVDESLRIMRKIAEHPGQYSALAIPYFACDDLAGKADELHQEISRSWRVLAI